MSEADEKQTLQRFLQYARGALLWKLEGLSDYDIRRPMTPTGTNLLGLVKHCAAVDFMYFGLVFDRPFPGEKDLDWHEDDDAELSGGMYATETESREQVTDFYRRVWAALRRHDPGAATRGPRDRAMVARRQQASDAAHPARPHDPGDCAACRACGHHQGSHRRCCRATRGRQRHASECRCRRLETALRQAGKHRPLHPPGVTVIWDGTMPSLQRPILPFCARTTTGCAHRHLPDRRHHSTNLRP